VQLGRRFIMTTECRAIPIGSERADCGREEVERLGQILVAVALVAIVLIVGMAIVNLPTPGTLSDADVGAEISGVAVERGASFDFLDHELEHAGGYILQPAGASRLAIGDASDPVQYTSLAARAAAEPKLGASPLAGPEYWLARSTEGSATCEAC
jgi:hypothetical protein